MLVERKMLKSAWEKNIKNYYPTAQFVVIQDENVGTYAYVSKEDMPEGVEYPLQGVVGDFDDRNGKTGEQTAEVLVPIPNS